MTGHQGPSLLQRIRNARGLTTNIAIRRALDDAAYALEDRVPDGAVEARMATTMARIEAVLAEVLRNQGAKI